MTLRRLACAVLALVIGGVATFVVSAGAGQAAAPKTGWKPTAGALFNQPRASHDKEYRLETQIIDAVHHAPKGSYVEMVMFSYDLEMVSDALIGAYHRGVHIQVIVNDHELPRAQIRLKHALGTNRNKPSFWYQCVSSCRGQGDVQHTKFVLFSKTGAAKDVAMFGSLNMKKNGAVNQWNDMTTIDGNTALYNELDQVFQQMKLDRFMHPMYIQEPAGKNIELYVLPFPRDGKATPATKYTDARDPIIQILKNVRCTGAGTPSGRTIIRVDMHAWADERGQMLARRFEQLWQQGCDVKVMIGFAGHGVLSILRGVAPGRGSMPRASTGFDTNKDGIIDLYSHQKVLLIDGHYGSATHKKVVVSGSSNYQNGGVYGDELVVRMFSNSLFNQYYANWNYIWNGHTEGFARTTQPTANQG
jgi:phosphatidylserine/phosphatidylglycerophosphate/cardiolipin synthase-like enzyme